MLIGRECTDRYILTCQKEKYEHGESQSHLAIIDSPFTGIEKQEEDRDSKHNPAAYGKSPHHRKKVG